VTNSIQRKALVDECTTVAEHCLYTAQAHYAMASSASWHSRLFLLILAIVAAVAGILTSVGLPGWIGAFAAAAGLINAVAAWLGLDQSSTAHRAAASSFTCLRHEARSLADVFQHHLADEQLLSEVRRLCDRYNTLVTTTEPTNDQAYTAGRKKVKSGTFAPDFREQKKGDGQ